MINSRLIKLWTPEDCQRVIPFWMSLCFFCPFGFEIEWLTTDEEEEKKDDDEDNRSIDIENTDDDEETDDEFVHGDEYLHDDVDREMKDAEDTETGKDDEEIIDAEKIEVTKGNLEQARKLPLTSSSLSVSSGFSNQFLNLSSDASLIGTIKESVDIEINSLLDIQIQQEVPHIQSPSILNEPVSVIPKCIVLSQILEIPTVTSASTLPPHPSVIDLTPVLSQVPPAVNEYLRSKETVVEPTKEVTMDATTEYVVNDADQPQDDLEPKTDSAPKHDWFKQPPRPPTPDPEWNKCQIIDDQPGQPCLIDPNIKATPIDFSNFAKNYLKLDKITKADLVGPVYNLLKGTFQSDRCPFDLSKLLPLKVHIGRLTVASEYFFNNDLECFKSIDSERKYTTSITKTKAARFSKHNVFSHQKILSVVSMKVKKLHGYGYLEEIMVRRADRQMYKFKEGNFVNLHINDIEDMLLLVVQHKLFHLDCEVIVDLALALHMLTRNPIIKKRVEDIQLGVESYQKKLNITKPKKDFPGISAKEPCTPLFELLGVVYEELS
ncbi:hypothetical protein Tco_0112226, partial [Tanacetum coccineum]